MAVETKELRVRCPQQLDDSGGRALYEEVHALRPADGARLCLDFAETRELDNRGAAWLVRVADWARDREAELQFEGAEGHTQEYLEMLRPALDTAPTHPPEPPGFFENIGGKAFSWSSELGQFGRLLVDAIYWTAIAPFQGRGFRWGVWTEEVNEMGVRAIRIVALMNFLLGLIIAMMSSKQVEQYGLQIYVADLIMIGFARELAAIMTAVVVSARTGAAIAAELATMKVQEEIDALRGMGLNVAQFLVSPKLLALFLVLPCLWALGMISGIAGGSIWGVFVLGFEPSIWFKQSLNAADFTDLFQGFLKTLFFAVAIVLIGCHNGLRVSGGSRGVGLMTTRAVVMDIFMIIVIDIFFAAAFYYMFPV